MSALVEAARAALEAFTPVSAYGRIGSRDVEQAALQRCLADLREALAAAMTDTIKPAAWIHAVTNGEDEDYALSFAPDNFPLNGIAGFKSVDVQPLYTRGAIDAAVAAEREACAKLCESVSELHCISNNTYFADQCAIAIRGRSRRKEPL